MSTSTHIGHLRGEWFQFTFDGTTLVDVEPSDYDGDPPAGLGDIVAAGIKLATFGLVKECGKCRGRRAWLNKRFPRRPRGKG